MSIKNTLENAKKLGLTLKNIKTFEGHDTMLGFNADVCIDGKIIFHAFDSAQGGCYEYTPTNASQLKNNEVWKIIQELEDKLKTFPKHKVKLGSMEFENQDTLDFVIGGLISEYEYQKMFKRDEKKGILFEVDGGHSLVSWKAGNIAKLIKVFGITKAKETIQTQVRIMEMEKKVILNKKYLKTLGIKFDE